MGIMQTMLLHAQHALLFVNSIVAGSSTKEGLREPRTPPSLSSCYCVASYRYFPPDPRLPFQPQMTLLGHVGQRNVASHGSTVINIKTSRDVRYDSR